MWRISMVSDRRVIYCALNMLNFRCYNVNYIDYHHYGGRGITVCDEWKLFANPTHDKDIRRKNKVIIDKFIIWAKENGWERGLEIDRIDNNGNYEPNNCRWTTSTIQKINRRKVAKTSSKYRGVSWWQSRQKWRVVTKHNGKFVNIGRFDTELEAAKAYNDYIIANDLPFILNEIHNG